MVVMKCSYIVSDKHQQAAPSKESVEDNILLHHHGQPSYRQGASGSDGFRFLCLLQGQLCFTSRKKQKLFFRVAGYFSTF